MKFKFLGTEIYISFLFSAVLSFMLVTDRSGLALPTLFAVFIHESGHLLAMWAAGCQPKAIRLIPASVQIIREIPLIKTKQSVAISLCGPAANIIVFLSLFANFYLFKSESSLRFAILNLILAVFNLLPVYGLDGGDLLCLILTKENDIYKAHQTVKIITAVFALLAFLAFIWLLFGGNLNLSVLIIAIYLVICCTLKY